MHKLSVLALPLLVLFSCIGSIPHPADDTGSGDTLTVNGARVMILSGTHSDRGWWHGNLMAAQIKRILDDFFVAEFFASDSVRYAQARTFINSNFIYNVHFRNEAEYLIKGMVAAGTDLYNAVLNRPFDATDILMFNSLEELIAISGFQMGCSSLSSWGSATAADSALNGELVITRFWDWEPFPPIAENLILIVHIPGEDSEQKWVSAGWPGNIGACTGMNESGLGAFLDYGNTDGYTGTGRFHPVSLSLRRALENEDFNGDTLATTADIVDGLSVFTPCFASIVHAVTAAEADSCAIAVESDHAGGLVIRGPGDNTEISGSHLAVTNHFRKLYPPAEPALYTRYAAIAESLARDSLMTADRSWSLLSGAAGASWALYQIQYIPSSGALRWRASPGIGQPAHLQPTQELTLQELFDAAE